MEDVFKGSWSKGIKALAHIPLENRPAFKMAIHQHNENWYLYCAHFWHSGLSIVDITNPEDPRFIRFIPGPPNTWTLQIQIADGLMITSMEKIPPGWGGDPDGPYGEGFDIWNLLDPENPQKLGTYKTGGQGTHRNYYDGGRYVHATSWPEGFDGHIYDIVDIFDPREPKRIARWWRPGQWLAGGEAGVPFGTLLHGGAYIKGNRAFLPYSAGGFVVLDISDIQQPQFISDLPFSPPFQAFIAVHSAVPLTKKPLVIVNSEAIAERGEEPLGYAGIVDISDEKKPRLISIFPQPEPHPNMQIGNFFDLPGRFGPHNQHQPQFQKVLYQNEDLVFLTYFNAGLRVYDIADPRSPKEIAYFIPPNPSTRLGPLPKTGLVTQTEDVLVDARGNIFISDKNRGICVLRLEK
jgi:hypothetical protein